MKNKFCRCPGWSGISPDLGGISERPRAFWTGARSRMHFISLRCTIASSRHEVTEQRLMKLSTVGCVTQQLFLAGVWVSVMRVHAYVRHGCCSLRTLAVYWAGGSTVANCGHGRVDDLFFHLKQMRVLSTRSRLVRARQGTGLRARLRCIAVHSRWLTCRCVAPTWRNSFTLFCFSLCSTEACYA